MKLTAIIILLTCLQVSARGYTQVTLSEKNVPLQKVFKEIQKQTGYDFLCTYELLQQAGKVSVKVKNASLQQALEICLRGTGLTYVILDRTIVVKKKEIVSEAGNDKGNLLTILDISGKITDEQRNGLPHRNVPFLF
ncbi:MAG: STN domain-containing protein [Flavisolibacter sp.]